eukprot:jgi/Galph1/4836/GphlegSOOS_G3466.1
MSSSPSGAFTEEQREYGTAPLLGTEPEQEEQYASYQTSTTRSKLRKLLPVLTVIFGTSFLVAGLVFIAFPGWFWDTSSSSHPGNDATNSNGGQDSSPTGSQSENKLALSIAEAMDLSVNPCEDFYRYACGGWLNKTEIPPDKSSYGKSFTVLSDQIEETLRQLLEGELSSSRTKPGLYYQSCLKQGTELAQSLQRVNDTYYGVVKSLQDASSVVNLTALFHLAQISAFFETSVAEDLLDPTRYSLYLSQGGWSLPSREYYLDDTPEREKIREEYFDYIKDIFSYSGIYEMTDSSYSELFSMTLNEAAEEILRLETVLANISLPLADLRDPNVSYNPVPINLIPQHMHVERYLSVLGIDTETIDNTVILDSVQFFKSLSDLMNTTPLNSIKTYMTFHALNSLAGSNMLGERFYDRYFDFYGKTVSGKQQQSPKWKKCLAFTNSALGDALGMAFVQQNFSSSKKSIAENMLRKIEASFAMILQDSSWLNDDVKAAAAEKLRNVNNKIGYPEQPDSYDDVTIVEDDFFSNSLSIRLHESRRALSKLGKTVDKKEWLMTPQTVNAYYSPTQNEMVFPAAILQIPFFSEEYPAAVNFGGLGSFDDQGRKFDSKGSFHEWWTADVERRFNDRARCVADLYSSFHPSELSSKVHVNGNLTLGENIADLGGVKVAYRAYKYFSGGLATQFSGNDFVPGLNDEQLFFVSYAQVWCRKYTPETLQVLLDTDPHSPSEFRVKGPLSQFAQFANTFQCPADSPYSPSETCSVW